MVSAEGNGDGEGVGASVNVSDKSNSAPSDCDPQECSSAAMMLSPGSNTPADRVMVYCDADAAQVTASVLLVTPDVGMLTLPMLRPLRYSTAPSTPIYVTFPINDTDDDWRELNFCGGRGQREACDQRSTGTGSPCGSTG